MRVSNSKKELAKIISENGGWRKDSYAAQDSVIRFFTGDKPKYNKATKLWDADNSGLRIMAIGGAKLLQNRQRTILSRAEYFHLYPAPDAAGWIEWTGGECPVDGSKLVDYKLLSGSVCMIGEVAGSLIWRHGEVGTASIIAYRLHKPEQVDPEFCKSVMRSIPEPEAKPTIEQLSADYRNKLDYAGRKQDEADKAKMEADAALSELEMAIAAIGFAITPICVAAQETELVIADWRDLRVGDEVEYLDGSLDYMIGVIGVVCEFDENHPRDQVRIASEFIKKRHQAWPSKWRFISRPAK